MAPGWFLDLLRFRKRSSSLPGTATFSTNKVCKLNSNCSLDDMSQHKGRYSKPSCHISHWPHLCKAACPQMPCSVLASSWYSFSLHTSVSVSGAPQISFLSSGSLPHHPQNFTSPDDGLIRTHSLTARQEGTTRVRGCV